MENGFKINEDLYKDSTFDLKYDEFIEKKLEFESKFTKWIKIGSKNQVHLVTFNKVLKITSLTIKNGLVQSDEADFNYLISKCSRQTLEINGILLCFNNSHYYRLTDENNSPRFKISELFKNQTYYDEEQQLELIFNYKKNGFILMTYTNLFQINYNLLTIKEDGKLSLTNDSIPKSNNYLFGELSNDEPTESNQFTQTSRTSQKTKNIFKLCNNLILISVILILVLVLIILLIAVVSRTSKKKQKVNVSKVPSVSKSSKTDKRFHTSSEILIKKLRGRRREK